MLVLLVEPPPADKAFRIPWAATFCRTLFPFRGGYSLSCQNRRQSASHFLQSIPCYFFCGNGRAGSDSARLIRSKTSSTKDRCCLTFQESDAWPAYGDSHDAQANAAVTAVGQFGIGQGIKFRIDPHCPGRTAVATTSEKGRRRFPREITQGRGLPGCRQQNPQGGLW